MQEQTQNLWEGIPVIASYSRAQAIEDGVLVDLTPWATEVGFKYPVAITRAAWVDFIEWPEDKGGRNFLGQSERGRAHDVLMVLLFTIRAGRSGSQIDFKVSRIPYQGGRHARPGWLKSLCGPGDTPEPVITIMLPDED